MDDFTRKFDFVVDQDAEIHRIMLTVYQALEEKGYNPVNQIVGYILSEDPTYITNHHQARTLIRKVDRDELLQILVDHQLQLLGKEGVQTFQLLCQIVSFCIFQDSFQQGKIQL